MPARPAAKPQARPAAPAKAAVHVGIGGWSFAPWRSRFYPKGLRQADELGFAASRLTAIEINGTFYRNQTAESFAAWRDATPDHFIFTVKANRAAAYANPGPKQDDAIARFINSGLDALGEKLGPILWQFPPTRRFDPAAAEAFLKALPPSAGKLKLRHAIEARHESFADPAWLDLLRRHGAAAVIVDSEKQALSGELTAGFVYCRLQRNDAAAAEGYASDALDRWARQIRAWASGKAARECFVFCISGDKERAPDAAMALLGRLGEKK